MGSYKYGYKSLGGLLGASWVVISGVISKATTVITHIRGLVTVLITTHEPPSRFGRDGPWPMLFRSGPPAPCSTWGFPKMGDTKIVP